MKRVQYRPGDNRFKNDVVKKLRNIIDENTIIVCIGSTKVYGDSVGPKVGTLLTQLNLDIPVFGTTNNPIHSCNFNEKTKAILDKYPNSNIIAIDAASSESSDVGSVYFREGSVKPGSGLDKKIGSIGNYSIVACTVEQNKDSSVVFTNLLDRNNEQVELLATSITGLIFRSYELGPTFFHKIFKKIRGVITK